MKRTRTSKRQGDKLGFWSIVLLAINSIIGSGIFLTPGSVVSSVGSKALLVYFIAALFAAVLAISFAAAAKYVTHSGAAYAYAKAAFGENVGFYMGILRYFSASVAWGVMAVAVIKSTISIFGGDPNNFTSVTLGFIVLMILILIVNLFGQRAMKYIMNLATIGKLAALGLVIVAGVILLIATGGNHFSEVDHLQIAGKTIVPALTTSGFVMAVVSAFYAFTGFEAVASGSEDMDAPAKNLPRAIPLAILIIAAVYIGVVAVAMTVAPKALLETKQVVAIAAIFQQAWLRNLILVGALVSMFGINVASSFHTPRVLEAMAKAKQIPTSLTKRTKRDFPARTFIITLILAILVPMAFQYNTANLIILSATVRFLGFILVPVGVIRFYFGKNVEPILKAKRQLGTDVIAPVLSVALTIFLLVKYDWQSEFGMMVGGKLVPNWFAIGALFFGFVILPVVIFALTRRERKQAEAALRDEANH
ncbi:MAG: APC family permease [Lactobacillus sp.]|nr:APC family permease [Lactobacillus sp.]